MKLQGFEALKRHVPGLGTRWGLLRPVLGILAVFLSTCLFFWLADRDFAEWMPDGEIVILALGFLILSRFFSQRKRYEQRYGQEAYPKAVARIAIPGLGIVAASIAHLVYISGPGLPELWWRTWLMALGYVLVAAGLLLWLRAVMTAGIDNLAMLYVYYPDEGTEIQTGVYGLVRHPIYAAAQDVGFGLALIHANWYALLVAMLLPLFFAGWIRLVEEPELLGRFPDYLEYRKRVPAFAPKLDTVIRFWRILLAGS